MPLAAAARHRRSAVYRHLLVPTDGTAVAMRAAKTAIRLAAGFDARITAVHVMPPFSEQAAREVRRAVGATMTREAYRTLMARRGNAALGRIAAQAKAARVPFEQVLLTGREPSDGIVEAARDNGCDLIVMGSNARVGIERLFLGSVATEVLTHSKTPVLVCR